MNAWTDDGRGRTVFPCESRALQSVALALALGVTVLASSGCEISVDSSSTSSPGPNDVAQADAETGRDDQNTEPTDSSDVAADPLKPDPLKPGSLKPDSPTPDSTDGGASNADPSTPSVPSRESPSPGTANSGTPNSDAGRSEPRNAGPRNAGETTPDSPKPDSPTPDLKQPDSPNPGVRSVGGPKKELLPIESTARSALAREPGIEVITFDDLNLGMQADMVFREFLLNDRVRELEGQKVRLIGYMHGGVSQLKDLREFVLLRNTECKFGPGGLADHLVRVFMKSTPGAEYTTSALQIDGVLKVNPFQGPDGNTWSVYDIEAQSIKVIRR